MTVSFFEYNCNLHRYIKTKDGKNMKLTTTNENGRRAQTATTLRKTCAACYQKVLAQITATREVILAESRLALAAPERLLRLALNEAEAVAWQTTYPHLVFPTLATEKVQAVAAWNLNQKAVRRSSPIYTRTE